MATLLPLFTFLPPKVSYSRRWLKVKSTDRRDIKVRSYGVSSFGPAPYGEEDEAIALDIALPKSGLSPGKPFYLVLHGLSGGSNEVRRRCEYLSRSNTKVFQIVVQQADRTVGNRPSLYQSKCHRFHSVDTHGLCASVVCLTQMENRALCVT